jgi:hypothetical protein
MLFIKDPYWLGIGADALWAIGLLSPQAFDLLADNREFAPDWELRAVMDSGQVRDTLHIHTTPYTVSMAASWRSCR